MSNTSDAPPWGRRLWKWSFKEFINMIQRAAWTALATRRTVPANRPPDDRFTRYSPTGLAFARSGDAVTSAAVAADSDSSPSVRVRISRQGHQHNRSAVELRLRKQLAEDAL